LIRPIIWLALVSLNRPGSHRGAADTPPGGAGNDRASIPSAPASGFRGPTRPPARRSVDVQPAAACLAGERLVRGARSFGGRATLDPAVRNAKILANRNERRRLRACSRAGVIAWRALSSGCRRRPN
jgi:hypothetical protein